MSGCRASSCGSWPSLNRGRREPSSSPFVEGSVGSNRRASACAIVAHALASSSASVAELMGLLATPFGAERTRSATRSRASRVVRHLARRHMLSRWCCVRQHCVLGGAPSCPAAANPQQFEIPVDGGVRSVGGEERRVIDAEPTHSADPTRAWSALAVLQIRTACRSMTTCVRLTPPRILTCPLSSTAVMTPLAMFCPPADQLMLEVPA